MASYEQTMLKLEKMAQQNTASQMNWQEKMSKTSHQMEVKDLVAAGLNPVLSSNQGANSYTTSVDSAVNGIAGMASARESANATRFAARQSAAATRAAAAAQLEAARIAASASERNNIRSTGVTPIGALKEGVKNAFSIIGDNKFRNSIMKAVQKDMSQMSKNPSQFLLNTNLPKNKLYSYANFNHDAKALANNALKKIGVTSTANNRLIYLQACMGDKKALQIYANWSNAYNRKMNNAKSHYSKFSGSGIW